MQSTAINILFLHTQKKILSIATSIKEWKFMPPFSTIINFPSPSSLSLFQFVYWENRKSAFARTTARWFNMITRVKMTSTTLPRRHRLVCSFRPLYKLLLSSKTNLSCLFFIIFFFVPFSLSLIDISCSQHRRLSRVDPKELFCLSNFIFLVWLISCFLHWCLKRHTFEEYIRRDVGIMCELGDTTLFISQFF